MERKTHENETVITETKEHFHHDKSIPEEDELLMRVLFTKEQDTNIMHVAISYVNYKWNVNYIICESS